ncbi:MAG: methylmalonyl-CoA mutase family protein [Planctomycetota bacterium]
METWRKRVEAELKGADFERALVDQAYAGVAVAPVYTAQDLEHLRLQTAVDAAPFVRGTSRASDAPPWRNSPRYDLPHPKAVNRALLQDLKGGSDALFLQLDACVRLGMSPQSQVGQQAWGDGGCMLWSLEDWRTALDGVHLEMVQLDLDAGANTMSCLAMLLGLVEERGLNPAEMDWNLGFDPLGTLARDGSLPMGSRCMKHQFGDLLRWTSEHMPKTRVVTVSTETYHRAGATLVQELGIMAATMVHYLQLADALRIPLETAARSMALRLAMDRDLFPAIAGQRAARRLWSRVLEACGVEDIPAPWIHAVGSRRSLARRDPWTNALRASTQTFAAILGGAQQITTCAFDEALGQPSKLGRRMARNTQIILAEESRLGDVSDPAGGAFVVESLTEELSQQAWFFFQQIESHGGMAAALRGGWLHSVLGEQQQKRRAEVATGRIPITGVSSFPPVEEVLPEVEPYLAAADEEHAGAWTPTDPCVMRVEHGVEDLWQAVRDGSDVFALTAAQCATMKQSCGGPTTEPLYPMRDAEVFEEASLQVEEALAAGVCDAVQLVALGAEAQAEPRLGFAESMFRSVAWPTRRGAAAAGKMVCFCGTDAAYSASLVDAVAQARAAGATQILVAGRVLKDVELEGVTWVHLRTDVPAFVATMLEVKV